MIQEDIHIFYIYIIKRVANGKRQEERKRGREEKSNSKTNKKRMNRSKRKRVAGE